MWTQSLGILIPGTIAARGILKGLDDRLGKMEVIRWKVVRERKRSFKMAG
jgi:hypothetical protein